MSDRGRGDSGRVAELRARLPLLDRLIDEAPDRLQEPAPSAAEVMAILRRSVRRDIEALLNARRRWRSWPTAYGELAVSPVGYGIADFAAGAFNDPHRRDELRGEIEATIRRFDARLAQVRVSLTENQNHLDSTLRLRIDALLRVDPAPEPIAFDTLIDVATADVVVKATDTPARPPDGDV
jgi:type VI secretion system protein ImpF